MKSHQQLQTICQVCRHFPEPSDICSSPAAWYNQNHKCKVLHSGWTISLTPAKHFQNYVDSTSLLAITEKLHLNTHIKPFIEHWSGEWFTSYTTYPHEWLVQNICMAECPSSHQLMKSLCKTRWLLFRHSQLRLVQRVRHASSEIGKRQDCSWGYMQVYAIHLPPVISVGIYSPQLS